MDPGLFVVEMTKALAWPLGVTGLGIVFRSQATTLLERLEHLKTSGIEASFVQMKVAEIAESLPAQAKSKIDVAEAARASVNPKSSAEDVIFDSWRQLEDRLKALAEARQMGDGRGRFREPLTIASKLPLPFGTSGIIKGLHEIRNNVVQGRSQATLDDALNFVGLVAQVMETLSELPSEI